MLDAKTTSLILRYNPANLDEGTMFTTNPATTEDVVSFLTTQTPGHTFGVINETTANQLLEYYPADPSAGSPYNTGNNTFGRAAQFKRTASVLGDLLFDVSCVSCVRLRNVTFWSYLGSPTGFPTGCDGTRCSRMVYTLLAISAWSLTRTVRSYQWAQTGLRLPEFGAGHAFELGLIFFKEHPEGTTQSFIDLSVAMIDYWYVLVIE
jgi:hypothetical protein